MSRGHPPAMIHRAAPCLRGSCEALPSQVRRRSAEGGFTLVELMITLIVAAMVASSTFVFFAGQQRIYDTQTKVLNLQQNLWSSMETIARSVRAAGTGMSGCVRAAGPTPPDTGDPPPVGPPDPPNTAGLGVAPPATGLRYWSGGQVRRLPPLWIQNGLAGASDTLTVAYSDGTSGNFADALFNAPMATTGDPILVRKTDAAPAVGSATDAFRINEFILLIGSGTPAAPDQANDFGCTLLQITGINAGVSQLVVASTSPWNPGAAIGAPLMLNSGYPAAPVGTGALWPGVRDLGQQIVWVRFSINTPPLVPGAQPPAPNLVMERLDQATGQQVLAEGIEDLQIAFACDLQPATPDGSFSEGTTPATKLADEWTYNVANDVPPPACNEPQAVRISLVARTLTSDDVMAGQVTNAKPAVEDGVAGPVDLYRHRVMTTTVYPRNRGNRR